METVKCECGSDKFYDSNADFAMCSQCGIVYRKSTWDIVEPYKHSGTTVKFESVNGVKL